MAKVTFTIESDATLQTIFVLPASAPDTGQFVPLKKKGDKRAGNLDLATGKHHYLLRLEAGAPEADWTLTVQREDKQPVKREGQLDSKGNGGDVGQITIF